MGKYHKKIQFLEIVRSTSNPWKKRFIVPFDLRRYKTTLQLLVEKMFVLSL